DGAPGFNGAGHALPDRAARPKGHQRRSRLDPITRLERRLGALEVGAFHRGYPPSPCPPCRRAPLAREDRGGRCRQPGESNQKLRPVAASATPAEAKIARDTPLRSIVLIDPSSLWNWTAVATAYYSADTTEGDVMAEYTLHSTQSSGNCY